MNGPPAVPSPPHSLRWPIRWQLLVPLVVVVLLTSLLATAATVYWTAVRVRREQQESLRRVQATLAEATFPLTQRVLTQMSGFSGAEFVLLDEGGEIQRRTLELSSTDQQQISRWIQIPPEPSSSEATLALAGRRYLTDVLQLRPRGQEHQGSTLVMLYPEDQLTSLVIQAALPAVLAGAGAAVLASALAIWLAQRWVRPIDRLAQRTATIAEGDFTPIDLPVRNDEVRDLAESINQMTARLAEFESQVRHRERMWTLGQLGAALAHQLRNAAAGGRMAIELHRRECLTAETSPSAAESLDVALRQLKLMESYLRQFLAIGREAEGSVIAPLELRPLVEEVLQLLTPTLNHAQVKLTTHWNAGEDDESAAPLWVQGDAAGLSQLLTNLLTNAVQAATAAGGAGEVQLNVLHDGQNRGVIEILNTGPPPAETIRARMFEPFATAKPEGVGLGLYVARQIANRHGGTLSWERIGPRTCFRYEFPLLVAEGAASLGQESPDYNTPRSEVGPQCER